MPGPALSSGPDDFTAEDARTYVSLTIINNYVLYSTACLLVYELITSLDDEVARVWSLKWRLPKVLFMLNRYVIRAVLVGLWILADFPGTSPEFCRIYSYWQMIPLRLAILAAQALVVIRVWAIYNNSRRMFWFLTTLYAVEVAAVTICVVVATIDTQGVAQPAPLSCGLHSRSGYLLQRYASATWIAPVCFEFVMLVITLAKVLPRWTWGGKAGLLGSGGNPTLDILARDSLVYFGFIFTFSLTNAIIYELSFSSHYHAILLGPTSAISCIAVSRMMINIRALPPSSSASTSSRLELDVTATSGAHLSFADYQLHSSSSYNLGLRPSGSSYNLRASDDERYGAGGIPDTARTAYFDAPAAYFPGSKGKAYVGLPPGGYAIVEGAYPNAYGAASPRPGSARTSGDATRVGDEGDADEGGSVIEMELRKGWAM
ncbi:hypothetical protein DFH08DRAFT_905544 [Mycena albidolilacea]|uniref:DUF6533 domain-containing protein n=1 Tax=Mycena albidolilacea TaxID=1033008 RepID=A0AAD6Z0B6_9AGAR|nr:hypothetical protein DFH08DRAFT_905544 [Mycena albidolilacea]